MSDHKNSLDKLYPPKPVKKDPTRHFWALQDTNGDYRRGLAGEVVLFDSKWRAEACCEYYPCKTSDRPVKVTQTLTVGRWV